MKSQRHRVTATLGESGSRDTRTLESGRAARTAAQNVRPGAGRTTVFLADCGCVGVVVFRPAWLISFHSSRRRVFPSASETRPRSVSCAESRKKRSCVEGMGPHARQTRRLVRRPTNRRTRAGLVMTSLPNCDLGEVLGFQAKNRPRRPRCALYPGVKDDFFSASGGTCRCGRGLQPLPQRQSPPSSLPGRYRAGKPTRPLARRPCLPARPSGNGSSRPNWQAR
jgi:hypothetical protein